MIYILTGTIRSGKTSALMAWVSERNDVDGLLCPDDENGKRYFLKIKSKNKFELEVESELKKTVKIGNFKFLKSAFDKGNEYLISKASKMQSKYVIIDEVGRLELRNEGLHHSTEILIPEYVNDENKYLILVVRDYLLDDILRNYSIKEYKILTKEDLELLSKT